MGASPCLRASIAIRKENIEASGLPYTFLRPNGFMQNLINYDAGTIRSQNAFYGCQGNGAVSVAFRLALEAPSRFRAVAAVAANVPAPENFKCKPAGQGTSSVMIMNGTKDPLNPFDGGEVKFFGLFRRGKVRSSRESGQYFAHLNNITGAAETNQPQVTDGVHVEQVLWRNDPKVEVELFTIHGGGHVIPQPYRRSPRILGPTPKEPNGPAVIWAFFERQRPR